MLELVAEGDQLSHRWKRRLASKSEWTLGRDSSTDLPVSWDPLVSRVHVEIHVEDDGLRVNRLPEAKNPLFFEGNQVDSCIVQPGNRFVLGTTTFRLVRVQETDDSASGSPVEEHRYSREEVQNSRFLNSDKRIEVLSRLPDLIGNVASEEELFERLIRFLLDGLIHAEAVAIVRKTNDDHIEISHWDRRRETSGDFHTSRRLVFDALDRECSVLHIWNSNLEADEASLSQSEHSPYTVSAQFDWAVCTPVIGSAEQSFAIYFAGGFVDLFEISSKESERTSLIKSDIRFAELVGEIVSTIQNLNRLEREQAGLRKFFSTPILDALGNRFDTRLLEPRECDVTVMFCDLRGFSKRAELESDNLLGLLERVSMALEVMTKAILKFGGVIGDFHGDAALGFWGWPLPSNESAINACKAALSIRQTFEANTQDPDHLLSDFNMGIGLAHGRAVAGTIGTSDQVKVTVFGPVVNLASRLEGMTKTLRVPILVDESVAEIIEDQLDSGTGRLRTMGRVQPFGMERETSVSELLATDSVQFGLTDELIEEFERAIKLFESGDWEQAYHYFHKMPAGDQAQDYFQMLITQNNRQAPPNWDGVIQFKEK